MRRLLADRRARLYLTGQAASLAGDSCLWLAMGIWVKTLTHSTAAAGLTFFFFTAPTVLAPVAGLVADRVRRRPLLIVTNAATGASVLALLAVHGRSGVWVIDAVMVLYGVSYALLGAGQSALLTVMLAPELLADANGALRTLQESLRLIGPLAGAGLFVAVGPHLVVAIDAASFAVPVATLLALRVTEPPPAAATRRLRAELAAGMRHVWETVALREVVIAAACATAVFGFAETITYAIAGAGLHRPPAFVGVLVAAQGAGAVVGGPTAAPLLRRIGEPGLVAAGMLTAALGALLQTPPVLASVLAGAVVFGAAIPWIVVGLITLGQRLTPPHLQGRAYAAIDAVITLPQTLSIALGAALVGATGYRPLLVAMAAGMTLAAAVLLVGGRRRATVATATAATADDLSQKRANCVSSSSPRGPASPGPV